IKPRMITTPLATGPIARQIAGRENWSSMIVPPRFRGSVRGLDLVADVRAEGDRAAVDLEGRVAPGPQRRDEGGVHRGVVALQHLDLDDVAVAVGADAHERPDRLTPVAGRHLWPVAPVLRIDGEEALGHAGRQARDGLDGLALPDGVRVTGRVAVRILAA